MVCLFLILRFLLNQAILKLIKKYKKKIVKISNFGESKWVSD